MNDGCVTVVIADDDSDDVRIYEEIFYGSARQYCLACVGDGDELLEILTGEGRYRNLERIVPDFIILDIEMPKVNGLRALGRIKSNPELSRIPVYVLTTSRNDEDHSKAAALGAAQCYTKPSSVSLYREILQAIELDASGK